MSVPEKGGEGGTCDASYEEGTFEFRVGGRNI